jgi:hypothetical protein
MQWKLSDQYNFTSNYPATIRDSIIQMDDLARLMDTKMLYLEIYIVSYKEIAFKQTSGTLLSNGQRPSVWQCKYLAALNTQN